MRQAEHILYLLRVARFVPQEKSRGLQIFPNQIYYCRFLVSKIHTFEKSALVFWEKNVLLFLTSFHSTQLTNQGKTSKFHPISN